MLFEVFENLPRTRYVMNTPGKLKFHSNCVDTLKLLNLFLSTTLKLFNKNVNFSF